MKIITGIGRCGTSLLLEYAKNVGHNVGDVKYIEQYEAGNELSMVQNINNQIFKQGIDRSIYLDIRSIDLDVIKDPLFFRTTECIKAWQRARSDIHWIWCKREPIEIVKSQRRKPDMTTPTYRCFTDMIIKKEQEFEKFFIDFKIKFTILYYPFEDLDTIFKLFGGNKKIWDKTIKS